MGFPDNFIVHERKNIAYKQFGNSVVVNVIKAIVEEIFRVYNASFIESVYPEKITNNKDLASIL